MTDHPKLRRPISEEQNAQKPLRPSHQKVIENLERWVNSYELQRPKMPDSKSA
jgi:hypothetical protein